MNIVMLSPGYPAEMAYFTRALAGVGARVIGVGDQPPHALPERRPRVARALRARGPRRRGRGARGAARAVPARLDRPGRVPLGAVHDPGGPDPGGVRAARPDRRADRAVPRQGDDEAGARRRRHPHAVARQRDAPSPRSGRPPRRSATRSSSSRSPAPARPTPTGSTPTRSSTAVLPAAAARARGQRRGVRRRRGVHLRHHLRRRRRSCSSTCCGTGRGRCRCACTSGSARCRSRCATCPCRTWPGGRRMGEAVLAALGFRSGFTHMEWYLKRRRRGRVRRDRRPPARRPRRRPDELRHRRRHLRRLGAGRRPRVDAAAGAPVQRGRRSSSAPAARAGSPTPRASTRCWAGTASTSRCSTCCRSGRRAATGARRSPATAWSSSGIPSCSRSSR